MNLKDMRVIAYVDELSGEKYYKPAFKNEEMESAEQILLALKGLSIREAKEMLSKVSNLLENMVLI